jgi:hypothetical protein
MLRKNDSDSRQFFEGLLECDFIPIFLQGVLAENECILKPLIISVLSLSATDAFSRIIRASKDVKGIETIFLSVYVPTNQLNLENTIDNSKSLQLQPRNFIFNIVSRLCSEAVSNRARCEYYMDLIHTLLLCQSTCVNMINSIRLFGGSLFSGEFIIEQKSTVIVILLEIYFKVLPTPFKLPWDAISSLFHGKLRNSSIFQVAAARLYRKANEVAQTDGMNLEMFDSTINDGKLF